MLHGRLTSSHNAPPCLPPCRGVKLTGVDAPVSRPSCTRLLHEVASRHLPPLAAEQIRLLHMQVNACLYSNAASDRQYSLASRRRGHVHAHAHDAKACSRSIQQPCTCPIVLLHHSCGGYSPQPKAASRQLSSPDCCAIMHCWLVDSPTVPASTHQHAAAAGAMLRYCDQVMTSASSHKQNAAGNTNLKCGALLCCRHWHACQSLSLC